MLVYQNRIHKNIVSQSVFLVALILPDGLYIKYSSSNSKYLLKIYSVHA